MGRRSSQPSDTMALQFGAGLLNLPTTQQQLGHQVGNVIFKQPRVDHRAHTVGTGALERAELAKGDFENLASSNQIRKARKQGTDYVLNRNKITKTLGNQSQKHGDERANVLGQTRRGSRFSTARATSIRRRQFSNFRFRSKFDWTVPGYRRRFWRGRLTPYTPFYKRYNTTRYQRRFR